MQEIDVQSSILAKFAQEQIHKHWNIMAGAAISPKLIGNIHMTTRGEQVVFTTQLSVLPLRARFVVDERDKCLVPAFDSDSTPMFLEWTPPSDMSLYLMVSMSPHTVTPHEQFLVACCERGRHWRLPMTNIYENCRLCTGEYIADGQSYADAIGKALNQLVASDWQKDLRSAGGPNTMANSKLMFRFKPRETEGFDQLPPKESDWTKLCVKVGTPLIQEFLCH